MPDHDDLLVRNHALLDQARAVAVRARQRSAQLRREVGAAREQSLILREVAATLVSHACEAAIEGEEAQAVARLPMR